MEKIWLGMEGFSFPLFHSLTHDTIVKKLNTQTPQTYCVYTLKTTIKLAKKNIQWKYTCQKKNSSLSPGKHLKKYAAELLAVDSLAMQMAVVVGAPELACVSLSHKLPYVPVMPLVLWAD